MLGAILGPLRSLGRVLERAGPRDQAKHPAGRVVDGGRVDLARLDRLEQLGTAPGRRAGHLQVEAVVGGGGGALGAVPVGHDDAVEAPLALEDVAEEGAVLAGVDAVDPVVAGHHRPAPDLAHGGLEGRQVDLAQGALVHLGADCVALELGVVAGVVLDRRADALALEAGDVGHRHPRREVGVLGVTLEVAAVERRAVDVDGRRQEHARPLRPRLLAQRPADPLDQGGVPGRGQGDADREAGRRHAAAGEPAAAPRAVGAVGHLDRRDAQARDRRGAPHVGTGQQRHLLLQRQLAQDRRDPRLGIRPSLRLRRGLVGHRSALLFLYATAARSSRCGSVAGDEASP